MGLGAIIGSRSWLQLCPRLRCQLRRHRHCLLAQLWHSRIKQRIPLAFSSGIHGRPNADSSLCATSASRIAQVRVAPGLTARNSLTIHSRWLIASHRRDEAIEILIKLRGDLSENNPTIVAEVEELDAIVESSQHARNSYINIFLGGRHSGALHLGRRAIMGAALQTIQQWTGILAIVSHLRLLIVIQAPVRPCTHANSGYVGKPAFFTRRL